MTRSSIHFPLAEGLAALGVGFGAWLIHHTFQPASDTPNLVLLALGGLDMLLFFALLGYLLRQRLRDGESLPKGWIVASVVLSACFFGWIAALLIDSERLLTEQQQHREYDQQLVKLEDSLRQFAQVLPMANVPVERNAWQVNHDRYARLHDQLLAELRTKPDWNKELVRIDDQVQQMDKLFVLLFADNSFEQRIKWRTDFMQTSDKAVQQAETLRTEIVRNEADLAKAYRARWQAIGSSALSGVFLLLGCMMLWLVFDRELRRRVKIQNRLAGAEAHFRSLVEHQPDPVAVLDPAMNIQYVNPAWQTTFHFVLDDLPGRNLFELIDAKDRPRVQLALQTYDVLSTTKCRLSADYGIWHDVEMQCQEHDDEKTAVVRFHDLRESTEIAKAPQAAHQPDPVAIQNLPALAYLYDPATRSFSSVNNLPMQQLGYTQAGIAPTPDFLMSLLNAEDDAKIFRTLAARTNGQVSEDEFRLRDADGKDQWFLAYHRATPNNADGTQKILGIAFPIQRQKAAEQRLAEAEKELHALRTSGQQTAGELDHHRWLLGTHKDASSDGALILSAQSQVLSWNPAFVQMWKLSDETMSAHTWQTIAAHMETQVRSGWDDFQRAAASPTDTCWEMNLEGGRVLEVYAQVLRDHPNSIDAVQFHFRDVTKHKELESQLRDHHEEKQLWQKTLDEHEEHKRSHESTLREREKHSKHLEKRLRDHEERMKEMEAAMREKDGHHQHLTSQLQERDRRHGELEASLREKDGHHQHLTRQLQERDQQREELEADLRDHQERLHDLHESHERHADNLKAGKESMRRLANGIASDFNKILSVVLGNADVLHESLPKDHLAQTYVDEIKQAASHGTELSQRLLAFSRNHLLQMTPVDVNRQLSALEPKIRETLGQNVKLQWDYANQELWVKTDPHPLEQALMHVLTHARQHMPQGGTMTIHTSRVELSKKDLTHADMAPGPYIQMQLQDTSDGMDDETVAHVFEPYQPTREGQKGDLTLATAYGIVRQSGGCIEVDSRKGQGTEWTILLPSTDERPQAAGQEPNPLRASA